MVLIDMTQGILMTGLLVEGDAKPASVHAGFLVEKPLLDVIKFIYKCNLESAAFYYQIKEYSQALWHNKRYVLLLTT